MVRARNTDWELESFVSGVSLALGSSHQASKSPHIVQDPMMREKWNGQRHGCYSSGAGI